MSEEMDRLLAHAPFNYRAIDTQLIQGYTDEKLLKHVAVPRLDNNKGGPVFEYDPEWSTAPYRARAFMRDEMHKAVCIGDLGPLRRLSSCSDHNCVVPDTRPGLCHTCKQGADAETPS
jgi:hypothetical protein